MGSDRDLGMNLGITRRDFLNGCAVSVGGALLRGSALGRSATDSAADHLPLEPLLAQGITQSDPRYYPPALTGMRGSHPGSFEAIHAARDGQSWDSPQDTGESYDLIVVGAGMSGLAAAYFFRKMAGTEARILILDNHDDFGGHAKRNEFRYGSRTVLAPGGTTFMEQPERWPYDTRKLLDDVGINLQDPQCRFDGSLYASMGLRAGVFFNKEQFGRDALLVDRDTAPALYSDVPSSPAFLARTPLSKRVQEDYARLFTDRRDYFPDLSREEKIRKLQKISYRDYLLNVVNVHPDVLPLLFGVWCMDNSSVSAWFAFYRSKPGFGGLGIERPGGAPEDPKAKRYFLPGGSSDLARLIVKWLIPEALPGEVLVPHSPADLELQRLDYTRLDQASSPVRIRLNSTAVRVRHTGKPVDPEDGVSVDTREVDVTYVSSGKAYRVRSKNCVLACNNAAIPYLCPELPDRQKEALHLASRAVNLMVNVLIRDWTAFVKVGVSRIAAPWSFYNFVSLPMPVSFGPYRSARTPGEPVAVGLAAGGAAVLPGEVMVRTLIGGRSLPPEMPVRDKMRALRAAMYTTPFETFERNAREILGRSLASGGFDPARDIAAITVNRWPHGYALGSNSLYDPDWADDEVPWIVGGRPFGRITIANSDASGMDLTQSAIDEAHRAVDQLERRREWVIRPRI